MPPGPLAAQTHPAPALPVGAPRRLDACEGSRGQDEEDAKVHFDVARRMVNHATSELHSSVWAMRSLPIRQQSFPEALRTLVARIGEGHAAETFVHTSGNLGEVPEFVAGNLLLIVQEAVYNALRHGRPATVHVTVSDEPATSNCSTPEAAVMIPLVSTVHEAPVLR
jgi:signal transduction histidine kinase